MTPTRNPGGEGMTLFVALAEDQLYINTWRYSICLSWLERKNIMKRFLYKNIRPRILGNYDHRHSRERGLVSGLQPPP